MSLLVPALLLLTPSTPFCSRAEKLSKRAAPAPTLPSLSCSLPVDLLSGKSIPLPLAWMDLSTTPIPSSHYCVIYKHRGALLLTPRLWSLLWF